MSPCFERSLIRKALVIRPGALGDVLLTLPALQALHVAWPQAEIELMGNSWAVDWLPGRSVVVGSACFDRGDWAALFQPDAQPEAAVLAYLAQFDVLLSYATPPAHAFAYNLTRLARGWCMSFDPRPPSGEMAHVSEFLQRPLREWGIAPTREAPRLWLRQAEQSLAAQWWKEHGLDGQWVLAVHPGSGSRTKNWLAQRFADVAADLVRKRSARVLLLGGPADADAVRQMRAALAGVACAELLDAPLPYLAAVLEHCQAYVGNDSGVSHLAAALGVPTVAVFGPTDPCRWAPRGPRACNISADVACSPCDTEKRRTCIQRTCLDAVSSADVLHAFAKLDEMQTDWHKI